MSGIIDKLGLNIGHEGENYKVKLVNIRRRVIDDETFILYDIELPEGRERVLRSGEFRYKVEKAARDILNKEFPG